MFHRHAWVETERVFVKPPASIGSFKSADEELAHQVLFGVTTILYKCTKCGQVRTVEVLGDARRESPSLTRALLRRINEQ